MADISDVSLQGSLVERATSFSKLVLCTWPFVQVFYYADSILSYVEKGFSVFRRVESSLQSKRRYLRRMRRSFMKDVYPESEELYPERWAIDMLCKDPKIHWLLQNLEFDSSSSQAVTFSDIFPEEQRRTSSPGVSDDVLKNSYYYGKNPFGVGPDSSTDFDSRYTTEDEEALNNLDEEYFSEDKTYTPPVEEVDSLEFRSEMSLESGQEYLSLKNTSEENESREEIQTNESVKSSGLEKPEELNNSTQMGISEVNNHTDST